MIKFVKKAHEFFIAQINFSGGKMLKDDRWRDVKDLINLLQLNENKNQFICGDFNENLEKGTKLVNTLKELNFKIEDEELERLKE